MTNQNQETNQELYKRVHKRFYKMYKNIAMQIKIADEVIQEVGVRPNNVIGQQTAAATVVIRGHKLIDGNKEAKDTAEFLVKKSSEQSERKVVNE